MQHENRLLREKKDGGQEEAEVLQAVNADLLERNARLEAENRCAFCRRARKIEQQTESISAVNTTPPPVTGVVASIKAKLASKPIFAGHIVGKPTGTALTMQGSSSCSQLSSFNTSSISSSSSSSSSSNSSKLPPSLSSSLLVGASSPTEVKPLSRVERLKIAFLSGSGVSASPAAAQSRPFTRSLSHGFSATPERKWDDSESETSKLVESSNRSSLVAIRMEPQFKQKPPPPPVEAVVITRESSPRDETDSGYRADSVHDESSSSPRYSPDAELVERYNKSNIHQRTPPDDSIEVDSSFRAVVRGSVDSESVSVSSFSIISSDRSFERSESLLLTPRSTTLNSEDAGSRKSFGKPLKKRKMFKAAANAMFSLCGP